MNPIPAFRVPGDPLPIGAYAEPLLLLAAAVAIVVVFGLLLSSFRRGQRRERRICPEQLRRADVRIELGPRGKPVDVVDCSLLERGPVTCSKACIAVHPV